MNHEPDREAERRPATSEIDIWAYVDAIWRRRLLVAAAMVLYAGYSTYNLAQQVPVFTSTARILIEPPATSVLDLSQMLQARRGAGAEIQTQLQLLRSRGFMEEVVRRESLLNRGAAPEDDPVPGVAPEQPSDTSTPEASGRRGEASGNGDQADLESGAGATFWRAWAWIGDSVGGVLTSLVGREPRPGLDANVLPERLRDQRLTRAVNRVNARMSVRPVEGTHLVDIGWRDTDPVRATQMANTVAEAFIAYNLDTRNRVSAQATDFLDAEIQRLRVEVREDENRLEAMAEDLGIDETGSIAGASAALNTELASARSRRISAEADYRQIQDTDPSSSAEVAAVSSVRRLRDALDRLESQYEDQRQRLTPEHPQMKDLQQRIDAAEADLRAEEVSAYQLVLQQKRQDAQAEREAEQRLLGLVSGRDDLGDNRYEELVEYRALRLTVQNKRKMLEDFTDNRSNLELSSRVQGFEGASIQIVDPAVLPLDPSNKQWMNTILMAMAIGGAVGAVLALGLDYLDNTLRDPDDVERRLGITTLGVVSSVGAARRKRKDGQYVEPIEGKVEPELVALDKPRSLVAEEYRELRTALLLSSGGGPPRSLVITSATPGEGKTTSAINLAFSMADAGKLVLLVDGDLRRPRLATVLGLGKVDGFSNFLAGSGSWRDYVRKTRNENLLVLPSGPIPPNPAELFGSRLPGEFLEEAKEHFDIVIIDTPPSLTVVDALILASLVDGVALVTRANQTAHQLVAKTITRIEDVRGRVLGIVLNASERGRRLGYGRYGHYYSQYGYGYRYSSRAE